MSAPDRACLSAPCHRRRPAAPSTSAPVRPPRFHAEPAVLNSLRRRCLRRLTSSLSFRVGHCRATRARAPSTPRRLRHRRRRLPYPTPLVSTVPPPLLHSERIAGHRPPPTGEVATAEHAYHAAARTVPGRARAGRGQAGPGHGSRALRRPRPSRARLGHAHAMQAGHAGTVQLGRARE
jgi:hypothetical protein